MPIIAATIAAVVASAMAGAALTDADVLAAATGPYDKRAKMQTHAHLGHHHGVAVVVDYPCSDLCPAYTTRIVHYDLDPGPACAAAGGVERVAVVPHGIAAMPRTFCVPAVLGTARMELGS